jgi:hypothetical protein
MIFKAARILALVQGHFLPLLLFARSLELALIASFQTTDINRRTVDKKYF